MSVVRERLKNLWPKPVEVKAGGPFAASSKIAIGGRPLPKTWQDDLIEHHTIIAGAGEEARQLLLDINDSVTKVQGYRLAIAEEGITIVGHDEEGLSSGLQTLLQIFAAFKGTQVLPEVEITDWPAYKTRCFMIDMGRSTYPPAMIKRVIRILARLKMNQLHLHLYDDELCGIRFAGYPFGQENPYSISTRQLKEIIDYAKDYHVQIVPELEAWGHVGSLVYHYRHLRGGPGMYQGSSFLISEESIGLMRSLIEQVIPVMDDDGILHLGLDEAVWALSPEMPKDFTPSDLVKRYYDIVQDVAEEAGKNITLRMWADHAGRPIPQEIQDKVIIEPWQYWGRNTDTIDEKIEQYSSRKTRWMMAGGQSGASFNAAHCATRHWCKKALGKPNVEGVNVTFWMWNDLDDKLMTLFAGAGSGWNPLGEEQLAAQDGAVLLNYEQFEQCAYPLMQWWQMNFQEGNPVAMAKDRGPVVFNGIYLWEKDPGREVAPTVSFANTAEGHDFLDEHKTVE